MNIIASVALYFCALRVLLMLGFDFLNSKWHANYTSAVLQNNVGLLGYICTINLVGFSVLELQVLVWASLRNVLCPACW